MKNSKPVLPPQDKRWKIVDAKMRRYGYQAKRFDRNPSHRPAIFRQSRPGSLKVCRAISSGPSEQGLEELGGGAPAGSQLKAVQTGGPSGGCIPATLFNMPVDYDSLVTIGAIMGIWRNGGDARPNQHGGTRPIYRAVLYGREALIFSAQESSGEIHASTPTIGLPLEESVKVVPSSKLVCLVSLYLVPVTYVAKAPI